MIYLFLATGFEDIEALAPLDIIRRAGLDITTVSITGEKIVYSAHGVGVVADALLAAGQKVIGDKATCDKLAGILAGKHLI